jgi:hypothetical protein
MEDITDQVFSESEAPSNIVPAKPAGRPKTFKCPACAGTVTIRAVGITVNAVCSSCSSVIDVTNENYKIVYEANKRIKETPLEIGIRGQFQGTTWEVVGYTEKVDGSGLYSWDEYLLYNPYYGFRFLVQDSGHWNLVKVLRQDVFGAGVTDEVWLDDQKFSVFLKGEAIVKYVKGEFYWRARRGERTFVADYIAPPYMLSVERNGQEINVSLGEYMTRNEVADAFKIDPDILPKKRGVFANQPAPYQGRFGKIWLVAAFAVVLAVTVQVLASSASDNAQVYLAQASISPYQKGQTLSTPSFNLPKDGNVFIRSSALVQNDWVELGLSLVNEKTNQEYAITQAIEYYYGYDGGESWSEGKQYAETFISKIPSGNYRLLVDADAGAFQNNLPANFLLDVKRDVPNWSNFWVTIWFLMAYPFFALLRRWRFESKRWSESDYAPAIYKSGEDD